jgi:hypothetical protein
VKGDGKLESRSSGGSWASVAHFCNPTYLGSRDQENQSSSSSFLKEKKNRSETVSQKQSITTKGLVK